MEDLITKESLDWCLLSGQCHAAMKLSRTKPLPLTMIHADTSGQLAPTVLSAELLRLRKRQQQGKLVTEGAPSCQILATVDLTNTMMDLCMEWGGRGLKFTLSITP